MRQVNQATIDLIKSLEGLFLNAYHGAADREGLYTIGYGTIQYPPYYLGGRMVKLGDKITEAQAIEFLMYEVNKKAELIEPFFTVYVDDNQFGALVSFAYNLGEGNLHDSTLLKKVNANPFDPTIRDEFMKWTTANKVKNVPGLIRRRKAEADLYFTKVFN